MFIAALFVTAPPGNNADGHQQVFSGVVATEGKEEYSYMHKFWHMSQRSSAESKRPQSSRKMQAYQQ